MPRPTASLEIDERLTFLDDPAQRIHACNAIRKVHYSRQAGLTCVLSVEETKSLAAFLDTAFLFLGGQLPEQALCREPWEVPAGTATVPAGDEWIEEDADFPPAPGNLVPFPSPYPPQAGEPQA